MAQQGGNDGRQAEDPHTAVQGQGRPGRRQGGSHALPSFSDAGPKSGPIRWEHRRDALGVHESPIDHAPIGVASAFAMDEDRRSLGRLTVHGAKVPGVFIVVDREFVPAREGGRQDASIQRDVAFGQRS
jgi:hypothetical protein